MSTVTWPCESVVAHDIMVATHGSQNTRRDKEFHCPFQRTLWPNFPLLDLTYYKLYYLSKGLLARDWLRTSSLSPPWGPF